MSIGYTTGNYTTENRIFTGIPLDIVMEPPYIFMVLWCNVMASQYECTVLFHKQRY